MPRAALLSIHARVKKTGPLALDDPSLVQVWGPRYSVFVVAERDLAVFTLGRLPDGGRIRQRAEDLAARVRHLLGRRRMPYDDAGRAIGVHGNMLRYAALTGTLAIRWEGARRPLLWTVPPPEIEPVEATRELARRFLRVFGPTGPEAFARWAGIALAKAISTFADLRAELLEVRAPWGNACLLADDEVTLRAHGAPDGGVRLLPSGDAYTLGNTRDERGLLAPDARRRAKLWTPRVWPGALLVAGEIVGTWRRAGRTVTIDAWSRLSPAVRAAVVAEAESLPLPDAGQGIRVHLD